MKFMNLKRFASTVLAGVMAMSLAVPAFAESNSTVIAGTYTPIELKVTVPDSGEAIINPYGLPYKMGTVSASGQQITTGAPLIIQNKSVVALKVEAKVTGKVETGSGVKLSDGNKTAGDSSTAIDFETETDKYLHVEFQAFEAPGVTAANVGNKEITAPMFVKLEDDDAVLTADVLTTATTAAGAEDLILNAGDAEGALQDGGAAFFRLSGKAAQEAAWKETDTFSATIAFTFKPSTFVFSAGELTASASGASGAPDTTIPAFLSAGTVTLTPDLPDGVTATSVEWTSSDPTAARVAKDGTNQYVGNVTPIANDYKLTTITVTVVGSDGNTYSSSIDVYGYDV